MKNHHKPKFCASCGKSLTNEIGSETIQGITVEEKERIIHDIKDKAIKATMEAITPLLEKLEEANSNKTSTTNAERFDHEAQIQKLQTQAHEKIKIQKVKIEQRMRELHAKVAKKV